MSLPIAVSLPIRHQMKKKKGQGHIREVHGYHSQCGGFSKAFLLLLCMQHMGIDTKVRRCGELSEGKGSISVGDGGRGSKGVEGAQVSVLRIRRDVIETGEIGEIGAVEATKAPLEVQMDQRSPDNEVHTNPSEAIIAESSPPVTSIRWYEEDKEERNKEERNTEERGEEWKESFTAVRFTSSSCSSEEVVHLLKEISVHASGKI
jgi:hypothetical protein